MKKTFLLMLLLSPSLFQLQAQSMNNKVVFGIKSGYNHTVINGYETNGDKTGFIGSTIYGSLFAEKRITDNTFLNAGLAFSWVNYWNFLEIPIHIREMLSRQISIFAGPKLDLAADKFDKTKGSTSKFLGLSAEAGGQYDFSRHLFAEVAYSIGISKNFNDALFDINNGRRNNFRIGGGYRF